MKTTKLKKQTKLPIFTASQDFFNRAVLHVGKKIHVPEYLRKKINVKVGPPCLDYEWYLADKVTDS